MYVANQSGLWYVSKFQHAFFYQYLQLLQVYCNFYTGNFHDIKGI